MSKALDAMPPDASQWLMTNGPVHWADSYFHGNRLGNRTSHVAESFNGWILEARSLPVHAMMERIRVQIMLQDKLRRDGKRITEATAKLLQKSVSLAREYISERKEEKVFGYT
ncbi:hypothetical protein POJ06DRAFT_249588 [Lipomyces tetrasporus]|uniref:Uncharacterized protein n=1 Tax=Lipomyces tetrasporus TaxID=54092 RepID=A0AAD7QVS1_9ASCO|nr:uncharacterized protein POJ06DRAFT_249588 [Lipomyces tetrasporus]KAJ8102395.1 hypothetical protein POJ06DRAFT_249588 [Lipomyces tetrasporus]